jgi:hypothetical protein
LTPEVIESALTRATWDVTPVKKRLGSGTGGSRGGGFAVNVSGSRSSARPLEVRGVELHVSADRRRGGAGQGDHVAVERWGDEQGESLPPDAAGRTLILCHLFSIGRWQSHCSLRVSKEAGRATIFGPT